MAKKKPVKKMQQPKPPAASKGQQKHPGGRPPKVVDEDQVFQLARIQCTLKEMAAVLKCSEDTLQRRFPELIKQGQEAGRMSLRRWQFKSAQSGNSAMLKWLGQQHLGQSDKSESVNVGLTHLTSDELKSPAEALRELREKIDALKEKPQPPQPQSAQSKPNIGPPRNNNPNRNGHSNTNGKG